MRIVVFGATGKTGRLVLSKGVERKHEMVAFARTPASLDGLRDRVTVVEGDGTDAGAVGRAVVGADAVIVSVTSRGSSEPVVAQITGNVVDAAVACGVDRLVIVGAYGMVASRPVVIASVVRTIFAKTFADQAEAEELLLASTLDWTVVRPTRLTDGAPSSTFRSSIDPIMRGPFSVSRSDVAAVLLDVVESHDHRGAYINVSG
ncbi:NAD(P)-dependent oxidoreductase [Antrihabitans cavernicola]|nr:NAD(P)-binding oxidoreductase [Spelaeibacter cavernicola]